MLLIILGLGLMVFVNINQEVRTIPLGIEMMA